MLVDDGNFAEYRRLLLGWWRENARDFPWRQNRTPYRTAVAELMLRRTRAEQVVQVYNRFTDYYPTFKSAAAADAEEMALILRPLGLVWRAEGMARFFQEAYKRFGNDLPLDRELLQSLPGVGDYVSAAIVCFAGEQDAPLIDTNVVRVLGRIFGLRHDAGARRRADMHLLAVRAVAHDLPSEYHYALLDFGAKICTARIPHCLSCPYSSEHQCHYYDSEITNKINQENTMSKTLS